MSIHAPRVGSDCQGMRRRPRGLDFNPRSPCGERPGKGPSRNAHNQISIHAPRVGSDFIKVSKMPESKNFNPRSPCGERQQRCIDFSFASSAKRGFFVIFSKLGAIFRGLAEKGGGISFLDRCEPPGGNMGTWRSRSENQGVFGRIGGFTAKVFYFLFVLIAKVVES